VDAAGGVHDLPGAGRMRRAGLLAALLATALVAPAAASAQDLTGVSATPCAAGCDPLPPLGWEGEYQSQRVEFRSSRTNAILRGTLFAPKNPAPGAHYPGIVIVPGSSNTAREENYHWSARELASHGYVVVGVDPQGVGRSGTFGDPACEPDRTLESPGDPYPCRGAYFQTGENFHDAAESGVNYLLGKDQPYRKLLDPKEIGLAGHSLAGLSVSVVQARDTRVKAVVAWDSLHGDKYGIDQCGEMGYGVGGHVPVDEDTPLAVHAPGLSITSELECPTYFYDDDPDNRTRPMRHWKAAGVPSAVIILRGVQHTDYGQLFYTEPGTDADAKLQRIEWYTRAWFDLFLKQDQDGLKRLTASSVLGVPFDTVLSTRWHSGAYLPAAGFDCSDLRQCPGFGT
jgi:dienelactone hydrolase